MASEGSSTSTKVQATEEDRHMTDADSEDEWPKGTVYPINSKRIVVEQLRRLARILDVSADGSLDTLRQVIEGKLIQLDHEPRNMQVIVSSEDARLYLVDDAGVICEELEHVSHENFTSEPQIDHEIQLGSRTCTPTHELMGGDTDVQSLQTVLNEARLEIEGLRTALA